MSWLSERIRIFGPLNLGMEDGEQLGLGGGIRKELFAKVQRCYARVKLIDVGFCFGLLDPVRNINVGQAIACAERLPELKAAVEEEEEEDPWSLRPIIRCINQRSLDGLVAFLVALFPYLTDYRAMWYLNEADADPLVAARLVVTHRGMEGTFGFLSDTTAAAVEMALRCAAAAAQHPNPRQFALGWKLLSASLREVAAMLSSPYAALDPPHLVAIIKLLQQRQPHPVLLSLEKSWELASCRLLNLNIPLGDPVVPPPTTTVRRMLLAAFDLASCHLLNLNNPPPPVTETNRLPLLLVPVPRPTLRRLLLTTIHRYYLQALTWLPKDRLRSHYHHSLLHAGNCYGPLDPVSNIIVNTIWYSRAYPLTLEKKVEVESINTKALQRIAVRSLYGLVSFLCTRYPALTPGQALQRLQAARANLQIAHDDPTFLDNHSSSGALVPVEEAYAAAAKAAHHPKPLEQAQFLGPSNSMLEAFSLLLKCDEPGKVRPLLWEYFRSAVASSIPAQETKNVQVLGPWDYAYVMRNVDDFWNQHNRAVRMVKSAIDMYNQQHGVRYCLCS